MSKLKLVEIIHFICAQIIMSIFIIRILSILKKNVVE